MHKGKSGLENGTFDKAPFLFEGGTASLEAKLRHILIDVTAR